MCGELMKPHCMFFDEMYKEKWCRSDSVNDYVDEKMDGLIVIGTALATGLANSTVYKA